MNEETIEHELWTTGNASFKRVRSCVRYRDALEENPDVYDLKKKTNLRIERRQSEVRVAHRPTRETSATYDLITKSMFLTRRKKNSSVQLCALVSSFFFLVSVNICCGKKNCYLVYACFVGFVVTTKPAWNSSNIFVPQQNRRRYCNKDIYYVTYYMLHKLVINSRKSAVELQQALFGRVAHLVK